MNNHQLKVILSSHDLSEKNMDVDMFLANSIESQDLFFEILDLAEEQYDFHIENHKAIVEAISFDNNMFVLTITKLRNPCQMIPDSENKIYFFQKTDDFFAVYSYLKENQLLGDNSLLYEFSNQYYFVLLESNQETENVLLEYAVPVKSSSFADFLIEHGTPLNKRGTI